MKDSLLDTLPKSLGGKGNLPGKNKFENIIQKEDDIDKKYVEKLGFGT